MVEFVLNKRCFLNYPLESEHALSWEARVGPLLQSGAGHPVELPNMSRKVVSVAPTSDDSKAMLVSSENFTMARTLLDNAADSTSARDARLAVSRASAQLTAVTAHPGLVLEQPAVGAKAGYIAGLLQDRKPTVICVHSAKAARLMERDLTASGISAAVLDASVLPSERAAVVKELGISLHVLILPENSSTGIDVPQASRLIHADTPTSAAQELQRSSRACRLNSVSDVTEVIYLVLGGFPEEDTARQFVDIDV
jgi:superfamily II DNA/RNA helicase